MNAKVTNKKTVAQFSCDTVFYILKKTFCEKMFEKVLTKNKSVV